MQNWSVLIDLKSTNLKSQDYVHWQLLQTCHTMNLEITLQLLPHSHAKYSSILHTSIPFKAAPQSAGHDLTTTCEVTLPPHSQQLFSIGITFKCPSKHCDRIAPHGSLAKIGTHVGTGVADADHTGEIKILLHNLTQQPITMQHGQWKAQLIVEQTSNEADTDPALIEDQPCHNIEFGSADMMHMSNKPSPPSTNTDLLILSNDAHASALNVTIKNGGRHPIQGLICTNQCGTTILTEYQKSTPAAHIP